MNGFAIDHSDILAAAALLSGVANVTPILNSRRLDERVGARILLKAENLQRSGSFKFRGGYNALSSLTPDERARGVVAFSSGNHAEGVALAAKLLGISAVIVMPNDAPRNKLQATEGYGARVITYDRRTESREEIGETLSSGEGRVLIRPYDNANVMAGQGTAALELLSEYPETEALVVCVGGGGLLAGCGMIARHLNPDIELYGVEPEASNDHLLSRQQGRIVEVAEPDTIADGQRIRSPGELTWPINNALVNEFVSVTDEQILETMELLFEQLKVVVEPSGASALAAVLSGAVPVAGKTVGVTLSGGNIGAGRFSEFFS